MAIESVRNSETAGSFPTRYQVNFLTININWAEYNHVEFQDNDERIPGNLFTYTGSYNGTHTLAKSLSELLEANGNGNVRCTTSTSAIQNDYLASWDREVVMKKVKEEKIRPLIEDAKARGETLILGFSVWGKYDLYDTKEIIEYAKELYPHVIVLGGGPSQMSFDPEYDQRLEQLGFDMRNIGGGKETLEWLSRLGDDDVFRRDESGKLIFGNELDPKPQNLLHREHVADLRGTYLPEHPFYFKPSRLLVASLLPGCPNTCDFCQLPDSRAYHTNTDLLRERLLQVIDETRQSGEEIGYIQLLDSNPMLWPEKFDRLLSSLDLPDSITVDCFGDISHLRTEKGMEQARALAKKHRLRVINYAPEAVQAEADGDKLGKRLGKRLYRDEEIRAMLDNLAEFVRTLPPVIPENGRYRHLVAYFIAHPWQTPQLFAQKIREAMRLENGSQADFHSTYFTLHPFAGSKISSDYKGHFMPPDIAAKFHEHDESLGNISTWAHGFGNARYLDAFQFLSEMGGFSGLYSPKFVSSVFDALGGEKYNESDSNTEWIEAVCKADQEMVLLPKLILKVVEDAVELSKNPPLNAEIPPPNILFIVKKIAKIIRFYIRREIYMIKNNPQQYENEKSTLLIDSLMNIFDFLKGLMEEVINPANIPPA